MNFNLRRSIEAKKDEELKIAADELKLSLAPYLRADVAALLFAHKVRPCSLKPAETRVETELLSEMGEAPYAPLFPHSDKWGRPPMHHSALETRMRTLPSSCAFSFNLRRYKKAGTADFKAHISALTLLEAGVEEAPDLVPGRGLHLFRSELNLSKSRTHP